MNGGENLDLKNLEAEAAQVDVLIAPVVVDPQTPATPEAAQVDRLAEAVMLVGIIRPAAVLAMPCIKDAPDGEWEALHQPIADLLDFYNVDVTKYLSSPWAALAFSALPLVMRGVENYQKDKAKPEQPATGATAQMIVVRDPPDMLNTPRG